MEKAQLRWQFIRFVSLSCIGTIAVSCYIVADTFFVARGAGADGLTALSLAIPMFSLMLALGILLGIGGATRFAICRAQGREEVAAHSFTHAFVMALVFGLLLLALGLFAAAPLARLLGADGTVLELTRRYLQTILCFGPFFVLNNTLTPFVRNDNAPRIAMIGMILGSMLNILLDYVFIFPLGLGIFGAALATGIAPIASLFTLLFHFAGKHNTLRLRWRRPSLRLLGTITALGTTAFVTELSSCIVTLAFNLVMLRLGGNLAVAAYSIVANFALVGIALLNGVAQGMQPLVSQSCGRGDQLAQRRLLRWSLFVSLSLAALFCLAFLLGSDAVTTLFNTAGDPALQAQTVLGLRLYLPGLLFAAITLITAAFFSASARPAPAFLLSVCRGLLVLLPMLLLLSALFHTAGAWLSFPAAECVTALLALVFLQRQRRN